MFVNNGGSISFYPPLNTEVVVATLPVNTTINQPLKIDLALSVSAVTTANSNFIFQARLYRNGVLISTRTIQRNVTAAGTQIFPIANTYAELATISGTTTYEVRVIATTATNVTSAVALNRSLNIISFPI